MSRRLALVIGNSHYRDKHFLPLIAPEQDANDFAAVLRDPGIGGFDEVTTLINEPHDSIRREVEKFFKDKKSDDLLVFYFSGHGVRSEQGDLYLAQMDTEVSVLRSTGLSSAFITESMDESRSRSQMLILDCCFSGAFARNAKSASETSVGTKESFSASESFRRGSGRTVLTATDSLQYAFEGERLVGDAKNSVFTHYLVQGLRTGAADANKDGLITVDELFDYASDNVQTHAPRQTPCKWSYGQHGDIIIARTPPPVRGEAFGPLPKSMPHLHRAIACGLLLVLNSLLAGLGSLLWGHFPYWPALVVYGLACIHLGGWGLILAALTPVVSSVLGIGGAPPYLYIPVNVLQGLLFMAAFHYGRIDRTLKTWSSRIQYVALAVAVPSFIGGCLAWFLRAFAEPNANDPRMIIYALWWTGENVLPAVVPGIWLHQVLGELYAPFRWQSGGQPHSWRRRTLDNATPWMITLLLFAAIIIGLVSRQLMSAGRIQAAGWSHAWAVSMWRSVYELTGESPLLRGLVLTLMITILWSVGSAIRFAKRTWILEVAVSQRLPFFQRELPGGHQLATILSANFAGFRDIVVRMPPNRVIAWLNMYLDAWSDSCSARGGYVESIVDGRVRLVFGINETGSGAVEALQCALDTLDRLSTVERELNAQGGPSMRCEIGMETGSIVATEIGSRNRCQFTVLGEAVCVAREMEDRAREIRADALPVVLSYNAAMEAGFFITPSSDEVLLELPADALVSSRPRRAFAVKDAVTAREIAGRSIAAVAVGGR
ncbi:MAG TPA: caspase family protein [Thermoanaerobaculia bacterium]|jgi:class 3 adenylate cyclase|nr:caspase family protein [Thermoanaerobaculia bacterium]